MYDRTEDDPFEQRLDALAIWARLEASRRRDMMWEWGAAGLALFGFYVLWVVASSARVSFIDVVTLTFIIGGTGSIVRFEWRSSTALEEMARKLRDRERTDPGQPMTELDPVERSNWAIGGIT